jgi:hypothetical protein
MLNWEEIAARIENPFLCSDNEVQDLKDFCEKFPYSQVFPMLYLRVLSNGNHVNFEEELVKYAHKITDRVQLYNLLHQKDEIISIPNSDVEADILETAINDDKLEVEEVRVDDITVESEQEIGEFTEVDLEEKLENQFEEEVNVQINQSETIIDELEKEILASSVSAAFVLEEIVDNSTELPEFDLSIGDATDDSEMKLEVLPVSTINQNNSSEKTFLEWLTNSTKIQLNEKVEETETLYEVSYIEFEKPKKEFFSPIKKAKESLSEETLPVSETLAKIYQAQGNISKAIYVYQQLSLIIPEKKSYFATQIKSLKKKIN